MRLLLAINFLFTAESFFVRINNNNNNNNNNNIQPFFSTDTRHCHIGVTPPTRDGRTGYSKTLVNFCLTKSAMSQKELFFKRPESLFPV
jgi:hypothetical protein